MPLQSKDKARRPPPDSKWFHLQSKLFPLVALLARQIFLSTEHRGTLGKESSPSTYPAPRRSRPGGCPGLRHLEQGRSRRPLDLSVPPNDLHVQIVSIELPTNVSCGLYSDCGEPCCYISKDF